MAKKVFKTGSGKTNYPSDVTDEEWPFCAPYLTLMKEDAPQRDHPLRALFNGVRYVRLTSRVSLARHPGSTRRAVSGYGVIQRKRSSKVPSTAGHANP